METDIKTLIDIGLGACALYVGYQAKRATESILALLSSLTHRVEALEDLREIPK